MLWGLTWSTAASRPQTAATEIPLPPQGVLWLQMTGDVSNISYSRMREGPGRNCIHVLTWQPEHEVGGGWRDAAAAAASKPTSMKASGKAAACSPALISPLTDLDTSYRRPKQSFHCCGQRWTFIFSLRLSGQRGRTHGPPCKACGLTPIW